MEDNVSRVANTQDKEKAKQTNNQKTHSSFCIVKGYQEEQKLFLWMRHLHY